jgi:acetoin utilization deacetylase AcuC-like enzyme
MKIIYSNTHLQHNPPFEIYDGKKEAYAERPDRIESIVSVLKNEKFGEFISPKKFSKKHILDIHQKEYLDYIEKRAGGISENDILYPSNFIMDTYTPIVQGTYDAAIESVNICMSGAELVRRGEKSVYCLCRPPGHHAEHKTMGGYCYFNNVAIAANYLSKYGKVVILDIDFHHGNGTQNIFYERSDVLYLSLHADPHVRFPYNSGFKSETGKGGGLGYTYNYPLPLGTTDDQYMRVLRRATKNLSTFQPNYLIVSLGFDTYEKDPIGGFNITIPGYGRLGEFISDLPYPTVLVQEGGYNVDQLGNIAFSFLKGFDKE